MNKTIENLYYGNAIPNERPIEDGSEYKRLLREANQASEILIGDLTPQQKEFFNDYVTKSGIAQSERECYGFIEGFKLGVRLIVEAMSEDTQ